MTTERLARIVGILFLIVGILGFVPALLSPADTEHTGLSLRIGFGYLLGLFAVNVLHNMVHVGIGLWGLIASRSRFDAVRFARGLALFYGALAIMGVIPGLDTTLGMIPIFGHDVWLHAGTALVAAYFGYYWTDAVVDVERRETRRAA